MATNGAPLLAVNNIEVIYDHVILVLKGVSLSVPEGGIVTLLGANGAGKTTTLKAISNLLKAERGDVTKGSHRVSGRTQVEHSDPSDLVRRGVIQVMEGRHCFEHLTVEENLLTGAYTRRDGRAAVQEDLEKVYHYFPRLKERRSAQAGYTSGGRAADDRARSRADGPAFGDPARRALDGPRTAARAGDLRDRQALNEEEGVTFLLAEQNTNVALRYAKYGYILETGRVVMDGEAHRRLLRQRGCQGVLSRASSSEGAQELSRRQALPPAQAVAGVSGARRRKRRGRANSGRRHG